VRILGIHPGALGDLVLFAQLLDALRARRGGPVLLAAGAEKANLLAGLGAIDEAADFDGLPLASSSGGCDLLVSCLCPADPAERQRLAAAAGASEAIFLPVRPPAGFEGHLLDFWAGRAGVGRIAPPCWAVPDAWRDAAREASIAAGAALGRQVILIHPGSGGRDKNWPLDRFCALARQTGRAPVFVVGPTELDWWGPEVIERLAREFPTIVAPPLATLAGLAAGAGAYVGNDSGPTHLAAGVGTPTVGLFGATDPAQFAPRGRRVRVLADDDLTGLDVRAVARAIENR